MHKFFSPQAMKLRFIFTFASFGSSVGEECLGNLPPAAESRERDEAQNEAENLNYSTVLSFLAEIRTFFRENPDADF